MLALWLSVGAAAAGQNKCSPVSEQEQVRLSAYMQKKYKVPTSVKLTIAEDTIVNDSCYHKLQFHSDSAILTNSLLVA
jgi:hypothetical protein